MMQEAVRAFTAICTSLDGTYARGEVHTLEYRVERIQV